MENDVDRQIQQKTEKTPAGLVCSGLCVLPLQKATLGLSLVLYCALLC